MEKRKKKIHRWQKGKLALTCILSLMLLLGYGIEGKAAEYTKEEYVEAKNLRVGDILKKGVNIAVIYGGTVELNGDIGSIKLLGGAAYRLGADYKVTDINNNDSTKLVIRLEFYTDPAQEGSAAQEEEKQKRQREEKRQREGCRHNYEWVIVSEPGSETDGLEEYRCSCGSVEQRQRIPAEAFYVKSFYGEIKNAPENGSLSYDAGRNSSITDYIIGMLTERQDVTVTIRFVHEGKGYEFTIPAGTDFSAMTKDEEYFYGYFTFCEGLGIEVNEIEG